MRNSGWRWRLLVKLVALSNTRYGVSTPPAAVLCRVGFDGRVRGLSLVLDMHAMPVERRQASQPCEHTCADSTCPPLITSAPPPAQTADL